METLSHDSLLNNNKVKELCEQAWHKSFSSVTKQNLNSEVKEKEVNSKINLIEQYSNNEKSLSTLSTQNRIHPKPRNFIDNRPNPCGIKRLKNKILNEGTFSAKGIGRGQAFQKKMEDNHLTNHYLQSQDWMKDPSKNLHTAPISYQMEEVLGDPYSDAAIRRSLREFSRVSCSTGTTEESVGLERALSEISLLSSSGSSLNSEYCSSSSRGGAGKPQGNEWVPRESLLDPVFQLYDEDFPRLKRSIDWV